MLLISPEDGFYMTEWQNLVDQHTAGHDLRCESMGSLNTPVMEMGSSCKLPPRACFFFIVFIPIPLPCLVCLLLAYLLTSSKWWIHIPTRAVFLSSSPFLSAEIKISGRVLLLPDRGGGWFSTEHLKMNMGWFFYKTRFMTL